MKRIQGALRNRGLLYFYMSTSRIIHSYTDFHDVDEDRMTITACGGNWQEAIWVGIAFRPVNIDPSTSPHSDVASVCRHLKYSSIIRMLMMSTNL